MREYTVSSLYVIKSVSLSKFRTKSGICEQIEKYVSVMLSLMEPHGHVPKKPNDHGRSVVCGWTAFVDSKSGFN